ncbi:hypothetical protein [Candidatus Endoriftia persephonae]|jgi:cell fate (sporulation/competence/biofilm development) regulator YlbF (YheA/YmcA/DUF963 family)|uniref:DUF3450 domain-containing protein n=1 Tax=Candidatus Endoriftia persephonae TaxID=393765 RepID=A0A9J6ZUQ3_9GAMM|nr:hypothetical protein [Candidatus Endoriftia persephone]USF86383.1 DUF3450 domain-containing protein [Candidatus Endoriftia persephone]
MTIPDSVLEEIRARAKESWPDDKDMREYSVKEEIDGYRQFQSIDFTGITEKQKEQIIESAQEMYEGWDEVASEIEDEIEALKELKEYEHPNIAKELLNQWRKEAEEENERYFRLQLEEIEKRVRQHESIKNTRREIDPLKQILIELEDIVGNECYNGNIQNYSSWGELESEGRSFRYPVKFFDGKKEHKKWNVTKDIPSEELITGYYPFGANELNIYRALHKVLKHLEKNYGFKLPKT